MLLRRRIFNAQKKTDEWDYEAFLTDTDFWYGKRCPAIVFEVTQGQKYYIEWSNCRTANKIIYDMRKCGGTYAIYTSSIGYGYVTCASSGNIEIVILADGTLYVGCPNNQNIPHGGFGAACFDGDYIKIRKVE